MTDKQFEYILKSLRDEILVSLHEVGFRCEVDRNNLDPNFRYRQVINVNDVDTIIHKKFDEVIGE